MFELKSTYSPTGDQPEAINKLLNGLKKKIKSQCLLGVTGSGKTFTMANVIEKHNTPTLILCHNKTLAAQWIKVGVLCFSITFAIVKVLPDPVTPNKHCDFIFFFKPSKSLFIASG